LLLIAQAVFLLERGHTDDTQSAQTRLISLSHRRRRGTLLNSTLASWCHQHAIATCKQCRIRTNWRYVALMVVLWRPALSASVTALRWEPVNIIFGVSIGLDPG